MAATIVNIWVNVLGVWKKATPHVKVAGVWRIPEKVFARAGGVLKTVWADPARSLGNANFTVSNFDFISPFSTGAGWRMNPDGGVDTFETPPDPLNLFSDFGRNWLNFDAGHAFQVSFIPISTSGFDNTPVLNTFLETNVSHELSTANTTAGIESGRFDVQFIDKNAPGPAPILKTLTINISTENGLL